MFNDKILGVFDWIQHNSNSCLVINHFTMTIKLDIVSAVETPISENMAYLNTLIWWF